MLLNLFTHGRLVAPVKELYAQLGGRSLWAAWYVIALIASITGSRLAYSNYFPSVAWQCWSSPTAWKRDVARVFVAAILSVFLLWSMHAFGPKRQSQDNHLSLFPLRRCEWMVLVGTVIFLMLFNLVFLPNSFRAGLHIKMTTLAKAPGCRDLRKAVSSR
jgi:hypothetical protein